MPAPRVLLAPGMDVCPDLRRHQTPPAAFDARTSSTGKVTDLLQIEGLTPPNRHSRWISATSVPSHTLASRSTSQPVLNSSPPPRAKGLTPPRGGLFLCCAASTVPTASTDGRAGLRRAEDDDITVQKTTPMSARGTIRDQRLHQAGAFKSNSPPVGIHASPSRIRPYPVYLHYTHHAGQESRREGPQSPVTGASWTHRISGNLTARRGQSPTAVQPSPRIVKASSEPKPALEPKPEPTLEPKPEAKPEPTDESEHESKRESESPQAESELGPVSTLPEEIEMLPPPAEPVKITLEVPPPRDPSPPRTETPPPRDPSPPRSEAPPPAPTDEVPVKEESKLSGEASLPSTAPPAPARTVWQESVPLEPSSKATDSTSVEPTPSNVEASTPLTGSAPPLVCRTPQPMKRSRPIRPRPLEAPGAASLRAPTAFSFANTPCYQEIERALTTGTAATPRGSRSPMNVSRFLDNLKITGDAVVMSGIPASTLPVGKSYGTMKIRIFIDETVKHVWWDASFRVAFEAQWLAMAMDWNSILRTSRLYPYLASNIITTLKEAERRQLLVIEFVDHNSYLQRHWFLMESPQMATNVAAILSVIRTYEKSRAD